MEPIKQTTREQLCLKIIERIIPEAKKEALESFKSFPKQVKTEMQFSSLDEATMLTNLLTDENIKYDKSLNINDLRKFKTDLNKFLLESKEVFNNDMTLNDYGYEGQRRRIMLQFLALKKIEYLKKQLDKIAQSEQLPLKQEKIKWKGKPSEFGFLINELISNGYIEPPMPIKGDKNKFKKRLTKLCYNAFRIPNLDGSGETTEDNLYEEIKDPSVGDPDTAFFRIIRHNRKK
jgi:hypothetical protein